MNGRVLIDHVFTYTNLDHAVRVPAQESQANFGDGRWFGGPGATVPLAHAFQPDRVNTSNLGGIIKHTQASGARVPGLIAYWKMDRIFSTLALDESGNGYVISLNTQTLDTGKIDGAPVPAQGALDFVNDGRLLPAGPVTDIDGNASVLIRFQVARHNDETNEFVLDLRNSVSERKIGIEFLATNALRVHVRSSPGATLYTFDTTTTPFNTTEVYYGIAILIGLGAADPVRVWLDDAELAVTDPSPTFDAAFSGGEGASRIGSEAAGTLGLDARLDEFSIAASSDSDDYTEGHALNTYYRNAQGRPTEEVVPALVVKGGLGDFTDDQIPDFGPLGAHGEFYSSGSPAAPTYVSGRVHPRQGSPGEAMNFVAANDEHLRIPHNDGWTSPFGAAGEFSIVWAGVINDTSTLQYLATTSDAAGTLGLGAWEVQNLAGGAIRVLCRGGGADNLVSDTSLGTVVAGEFCTIVVRVKVDEVTADDKAVVYINGGRASVTTVDDLPGGGMTDNGYDMYVMGLRNGAGVSGLVDGRCDDFAFIGSYLAEADVEDIHGHLQQGRPVIEWARDNGHEDDVYFANPMATAAKGASVVGNDGQGGTSTGAIEGTVALYQDAQVDRAFDFKGDGIRGRVNMGASADYDFADAAVMFGGAAWLFVRSEGSLNAGRVMIVQEDPIVNPFGWSWQFNTVDQMGVFLEYDTTNAQTLFDFDGTRQNTWTHVAWYLDVSTGLIHVFVDSVEETGATQQAGAGTREGLPAEDLVIGDTHAGNAGRTFDGLINQPMVFKDQIAPSAFAAFAAELYRNGVQGNSFSGEEREFRLRIVNSTLATDADANAVTGVNEQTTISEAWDFDDSDWGSTIADQVTSNDLMPVGFVDRREMGFGPDSRGVKTNLGVLDGEDDVVGPSEDFTKTIKVQDFTGTDAWFRSHWNGDSQLAGWAIGALGGKAYAVVSLGGGTTRVLTGTTNIDDGREHTITLKHEDATDGDLASLFVDNNATPEDTIAMGVTYPGSSIAHRVGGLRELTSQLPTTTYDWDPGNIIPASHVADGLINTMPEPTGGNTATGAGSKPRYIAKDPNTGRPSAELYAGDSHFTLGSLVNLESSDITISAVFTPLVDLDDSFIAYLLRYSVSGGVLALANDFKGAGNNFYVDAGGGGGRDVFGSHTFLAGTTYTLLFTLSVAVEAAQALGTTIALSEAGGGLDSSGGFGVAQFDQLGNASGAQETSYRLHRLRIRNSAFSAAEIDREVRYHATRYGAQDAILGGVPVRAPAVIGYPRGFSDARPNADIAAYHGKYLDVKTASGATVKSCYVRPRVDPEPVLVFNSEAVV